MFKYRFNLFKSFWRWCFEWKNLTAVNFQLSSSSKPQPSRPIVHTLRRLTTQTHSWFHMNWKLWVSAKCWISLNNYCRLTVNPNKSTLSSNKKMWKYVKCESDFSHVTEMWYIYTVYAVFTHCPGRWVWFQIQSKVSDSE